MFKRTRFYILYRRMHDAFAIKRRVRSLPSWSAKDQELVTLYRQFVSSGSLVFDIGANIGARANAFSRLGATTIAVEPQPACVRALQHRFRYNNSVVVENKAVSDTQHPLRLHVCDSSTLSSANKDWITAMQSTHSFSSCNWLYTVVVPTLTLDDLIKQYGQPDFVKIDVEGLEHKVISGLSQPIPLLSFEHTPHIAQNTLSSLHSLSSLANYSFQFIVGENRMFYFDDWQSVEQLKSKLNKQALNFVGDIYARLISPQA